MSPDSHPSDAAGPLSSRRDTLATLLLCAGLLGVGALAWALQLQEGLRVDAAALGRLPVAIAGWQAREVPLDSSVESVLRADFNVQRAYVHPSGEFIWLYIGYYGTDRGGRPEHTPRGCYTGAGWGITSARVLRADPAGALSVNEYVVEREGERRLVHFWYRSHRRTGMVGGLDQNWDRLVGRLFHGRADGALVRLSTGLAPGEEIGARSRLLSFANALDPVIAAHWPSEEPREP